MAAMKPADLLKSRLDDLRHSNDCYLGLAVSGRNQGEFILIAKDSDTLRKFWNQIMNVEMDESGIKSVAVVGVKNG